MGPQRVCNQCYWGQVSEIVDDDDDDDDDVL